MPSAPAFAVALASDDLLLVDVGVPRQVGLTFHCDVLAFS